MALWIQKYGGTSVGTPERIQSVADRISKARALGHRLVVVVSAMGSTTDDLLSLAARVCQEPPHREMDMLLTAGERISMALLSMALADRGVPALSLTGSQSGIITDNNHRRARIRRILGDRVREAIAANKVAIVAGFQGVSQQKDITTLGRGGSDTTAVALAAALQADRCEIFTDVSGVYSADPRRVASARLWDRLPYEPMLELASRGAGVLHPRSVALAHKFRIPLWVKNSLRPEEEVEEGGTLIMDRKDMPPESRLEGFRFVGVTADEDKCLVTVDFTRPSVLGSLLDRTAEHHLNVLTPVFFDKRLWFFGDRESLGEWKRHLDQLMQDGFVERYDLQEDQVPVSLVGDGIGKDSTALGKVWDVLSQQGISPRIVLGSPLALSAAVAASQAPDAVKALHRAFLEN